MDIHQTQLQYNAVKLKAYSCSFSPTEDPTVCPVFLRSLLFSDYGFSAVDWSSEAADSVCSDRL